MMNKKAFFLLGFIMFLTMSGYGIVLPSLPFLADHINLTSFQMSSLITGWATAQLITAPMWGRLADTLGRKPVLVMGLFGFGIAFLAHLFVTNYWQFLFARILGASLSSGTYPAVLSFVSDSTDGKHRNVAIAKMGAFNGLGFLCGPAIGSIFAQLGMFVPFIVAGSLALITTPLAILFLREPEVQETVIRQKTSYFKSFSMLTKRGYKELYIVTLGVAIAMSSFLGLIGYFMISRFDATSGMVGLAFSIEAGTAVLVQFFLLERLYSIWTEEKIKINGLIMTAVGFGLIAISPHWLFVIVGCAFLGFGTACIMPVVVSLLSKMGRYGQGVTMGMNESMDSLGRIVGPLIGGALFSISIVLPFISSALIPIGLLLIIIANAKKGNRLKLIEEENPSSAYKSR